jgi:hypothetical protein
VFARRALFVGLDGRRKRAGGGRYHDGWLLDPESLLPTLIGGDAGERSRAARAVLAGSGTHAAAQRLAAIAREAHLSHVYVIAREGAAARRLEKSDRYRALFRNAAATVFRLDLGAP